jgi:transient receptor potential cation channel subfamily A member 1
MLKYFLDHDSVKHIAPQWMMTIIWEMENREIDRQARQDRQSKIQKCFHILLDHPKYNVHEKIPDYDNITVLHFAASKSEYASIELLKKGASLDSCSDDGKMAIEYMDNRVLGKFLDKCITKYIPEKGNDIDCNDYFMVFDYSFLKAASNEIQLIEYMTRAIELQPLIEHPVIASFLFLKWLGMNCIFFLNLLLFSICTNTFIWYLHLVYVNQQNQRDPENYGWFLLLQFLAYVSFIYFLIKEIILFHVFGLTSYLKNARIGVLCVFVMAVTLILPLKDQETRRSIAAVLFLGLAIEWTLKLGKLSICSVSNYIVMLKKVAINFLRTLTSFSIILLAFALSFYTLINSFEENTEHFNTSASNKTEKSKNLADEAENISLLSASFHVILMLTNEFEKISEGVTDLVFGRLILLVFVLSMSIVMMNLLVGLTVSDTAATDKKAEWHKWWERAKSLGNFEYMMSLKRFNLHVVLLLNFTYQ